MVKHHAAKLMRQHHIQLNIKQNELERSLFAHKKQQTPQKHLFPWSLFCFVTNYTTIEVQRVLPNINM